MSATPLLEAEATHRAIKLAQVARRAALHRAPVGDEALAEVTTARDEGFNAFAETCPQYLFLSTDDLARPASRARSTSARRRCAPSRAPGGAVAGAAHRRPVGGLDRPLPVLLQGAEGDGPRRLLQDPERPARRRDPDGPAAPGRRRGAHLAAALDRDRLRHAGADVRALPAQGHDRARLRRRHRRLRPDRDPGALGVDAPHGRRLLLLRGPRDHRQGPDGAVARPGDRRRRAVPGSAGDGQFLRRDTCQYLR